MKIFLITILLLMGAGCSQVDVPKIGAELTEAEKIQEIKTDVDTLQANWIKSNDNYKQVPKTKDANGIEYEVHEYITGKGEKGYQIFYYEDGKIVESKGFGVLADERTWTKPIITPTSTI